MDKQVFFFPPLGYYVIGPSDELTPHSSVLMSLTDMMMLCRRRKLSHLHRGQNVSVVLSMIHT